MKPRLTLPSAFCSEASASACAAADLKSCAACHRPIAAQRLCRGAAIAGLIRHAGQHLGDMARFDVYALAREPAGDMHQAAEIAAEHGAGAGAGDVAQPWHRGWRRRFPDI